MIAIVEVEEGKRALVHAVLDDLPEWFARLDSRAAYARDADSLEVLAARLPTGENAAFLCLKRHSAVAAEAYVLGVRRQWHRRGIGAALFKAAEDRLVRQGVRYLTVKTLSADHPDPHYAATRLFYEALGFEPIEVFRELWGADTPCLLMLKALPPP